MKIGKKIKEASWRGVVIPLATLIAYSIWAFRPAGQFLQAKKMAGTLPEEIFGFPPGEPERAFSQLFGLQGDYVMFQVIDIPYAILNFFTFSAIIALALKKFNLGHTPLRFTLFLPALYLVSEFVENILLVLLVKGDGGPASVALLQQMATSLKWTVGMPTTLLAVLSLLALIVAIIVKQFFGKKS